MISPPSSATVGWSDCGHGNYRPGVVLDSFIGSGTTAVVARKHNRHCIGIELNPDYVALAARRLAQQSLFAGAGDTVTLEASCVSSSSSQHSQHSPSA